MSVAAIQTLVLGALLAAAPAARVFPGAARREGETQAPRARDEGARALPAAAGSLAERGLLNASWGCRRASPGSLNYCGRRCRCRAGEGDCDTNRDCMPGLRCVRNVGARYGFASGVDVCEPRRRRGGRTRGIMRGGGMRRGGGWGGIGGEHDIMRRGGRWGSRPGDFNGNGIPDHFEHGG
mmetsp:Transcript_142347/g.442632  ORF Transcript_142347/g.442632 Transcript_142347/m.442632 type:complete len:181 (+) Transcript_142347:89-631(+)